MKEPEVKTPRRRNKFTYVLFIVPFLMFGFCFALVPLYNVFCSAFGINGKTNTTSIRKADTAISDNRNITIQFLATNNEKLPWSFKPNKVELTLHPGENKRVTYYAKNNSDHTMTIQAIPSVSPGNAAKYLLKTECFCFTQQTLGAHKSMDMPILFHIDPDLPKNIHVITLSYTIFDLAKLKNPTARKGGRITR